MLSSDLKGKIRYGTRAKEQQKQNNEITIIMINILKFKQDRCEAELTSKTWTQITI